MTSADVAEEGTSQGQTRGQDPVKPPCSEVTTMQITRRYTREGGDPFESFSFAPRTSRISNPDGSVVFEMKDLLAPEAWSQVAVDILAQKYFRRAGLPLQSQKAAEPGVPAWLQRTVPVAGDPCTGHETDARQVFRRLAGCWTYWGWKGGYFTTEADARAFHDEVCHMLAAQMAAPNSPAVVQYRAALGLRHRGARPGSLPRGPGNGSGATLHCPLTNTRPRTPASSKPSGTTWSTKAASWTCGSARLASSSTAPAPGRTSPTSAVKASRSRAAANPAV